MSVKGNKEPADRVSNTVNVTALIGHAANSIVTLVAAFFLFSGTQGGNNASMLESAFNQINKQEVTMTNMRAELIKTQIRVIDLESKLRENVNRKELLQGYINSLPFPAWIKKRREDGMFEMVMINEAYTAEYKKTPTQYIGKTDYEVHPHDLAVQYEINDLQVATSGGYIRTIEDVKVNGKRITVDIFKFAIELPVGGVGVGGVAIRDSN